MLNNEVDLRDYNTPENIQDFLDKLDAWINLKDIQEVKKNGDAEKYLNLTYVQLRSLRQDEALAACYILYGYAHYVQRTLNKEKAVLDFAESSLYYIVADKINNYGDGYTKWEQKYYSAVKENPLARELMKLKTHCLSRVNLLSKTVDIIEKQSSVLEKLARNA